MRIAVVAPSSGFVGGLEQHAFDLAASLTARGHELTLLHGASSGRDPEHYASAFARVVPLAAARSALDGIEAVWFHGAKDAEELAPFGGLPVVVAAHDHDHTCVRSHRYTPDLVPCHRAPGIACVTHGCVVVRDRRPGRRLPVMLRSPFALRDRLHLLARRALLVANSRYVGQSLVKAGVPRDRVHVIHPIPPDVAEPPAPLPAERRLCVVGSLIRGKGVDIAIRALGFLPGDVVLEVVGDGPSRKALARLAERVAPNRVRFRGWIQPAEVGRIYDAISAVVVPARWPEPFGMTGIEAMRRGRAVIGAAHGGIPEWLVPGRAGALFTPGSPEELARAAETVLDDPGAGLRARHFAEERFPHRACVDAVESLLTAIAAPGPPA